MDVTTDRPSLTFERHSELPRLDCEFIAGCDGFHGVSHATVPPSVLREFDKTHPFGWLGMLLQTPRLPAIPHAHHPRGFALASARNPSLSRDCIQVPPHARIEDWSDDRLWSELIQ